ncbi:hypothetical protein B0H16DRAFT_381365 [Mycena metata]|uniref:Transaldolase n=1 Tax=Mycena metata TaxID=1033252 RepID=A0AAD7HHL7_9AGAR|nr:hypothetical protein B0H16DRAFT_381365 [Mycena metata]
MYPRPSPSPNQGRAQNNNATGQFTAARARTLRHENKENAAPNKGHSTQTPSTKSRAKLETGPTTLRRALAAANTAVIGDTLDFPTVSVEELNGTVLTPANIFAALERRRQGQKETQNRDDDVYCHLWVATQRAIEERIPSRDIPSIVQSTMELFVVELGTAIYERNGLQSRGLPHLAFVDPRQNDDMAGMMGSARRLVALFRARGVGAEKILISIPATEDGVSAAKALEAEGIHTNLILVVGLMHAAICAHAGATAISIAVGPLLQFHERKRKADYHELKAHPGIEVIQATLEYFKLHGIRARLVGCDFRQLAELSALPGFDAVCLSKEQLLEAARYRGAQYGGETRSAVVVDLDRTRPPQHQASMRARQAQHPSGLLEQLDAVTARSSVQSPSGNGIQHGTKTGNRFMLLLSGAARRTLAAQLYPALGRMELQMTGIEQAVREEVVWQLSVRTMNLAVLYDVLRGTPPSGLKKTSWMDHREAEAAPELLASNQVGAKAEPRPHGKGVVIEGPKRRGEGAPSSCERENEDGLIEGVEYF